MIVSLTSIAELSSNLVAKMYGVTHDMPVLGMLLPQKAAYIAEMAFNCVTTQMMYTERSCHWHIPVTIQSTAAAMRHKEKTRSNRHPHNMIIWHCRRPKRKGVFPLAVVQHHKHNWDLDSLSWSLHCSCTSG
jgi:hypothetical protein